MHACMHMHACVLACMHAHACLLARLLACMHMLACMLACLLACMHAHQLQQDDGRESARVRQAPRADEPTDLLVGTRLEEACGHVGMRMCAHACGPTSVPWGRVIPRAGRGRAEGGRRVGGGWAALSPGPLQGSNMGLLELAHCRGATCWGS